MAKHSSFQPNWASHPGATIADILHEKNLSLQEFAKKMEATSDQTRKLIDGGASITHEIARKLESILGASETFWMNRESQYQEDMARMRLPAEPHETAAWLDSLPLKDMIRFEWISRSKNKNQKKEACLRFFGVSNINQWHEKYNDLLRIAAFRTSSSFDSQPESIVTWLRQGEVVSESISCNPWDAELFRESLLQARHYSRIQDPKIFIPEIQKLFAKCGVALAVVRTPSRCRASGATYFISPEKALLLLSFRYLSDDHFWFSLFHEAGHLLLHGNKSLFLEAADKSANKEESEANEFAAQILIPPEFQSELRSLDASNWRQIIRFAKRIEISPGIVVGQLQHLGNIRHNQLNKLKARFKWID